MAVLPFQINGGADVDSLNDELPALFAQRLAARGFKVVPPKDTLRLLRQQKVSQLNLAAARWWPGRQGRGLRRLRQLQQDRRRLQHRCPHGGRLRRKERAALFRAEGEPH
ncbi:MAG: hypothetical protein V8Q84_07300 [Bilophila sp.]